MPMRRMDHGWWGCLGLAAVVAVGVMDDDPDVARAVAPASLQRPGRTPSRRARSR